MPCLRLARWLLTLAATQAILLFLLCGPIARPLPEAAAGQWGGEDELFEPALSSCQRDTPPGKPVASCEALRYQNQWYGIVRLDAHRGSAVAGGTGTSLTRRPTHRARRSQQ